MQDVWYFVRTIFFQAKKQVFDLYKYTIAVFSVTENRQYSAELILQYL